MNSMSIENRLLEAIRLLSIEQQQRLLELVLSFVQFTSPAHSILEFAGCVGGEDALLMEKAVNEDCNTID